MADPMHAFLSTETFQRLMAYPHGTGSSRSVHKDRSVFGTD